MPQPSYNTKKAQCLYKSRSHTENSFAEVSKRIRRKSEDVRVVATGSTSSGCEITEKTSATYHVTVRVPS